MKIDQFLAAYHESRNGANYFVRHPLVRSFQFSDGVEQVAAAGCFWLLDVVATECLKPLRASGEVNAIVRVTVDKDAKAMLSLTVADDAPAIWRKHLDYTDMPSGQWLFELADEGERFALILLSEH